MKVKSVVPRERANCDLDDAIEYYLKEGGARAAVGLIDCVERAYDHIARHPASGSLRFSDELGLPGLRCWQVDEYPYQVFYVEQSDRIDVWRVLHAQRDIPVWMHSPGGP